jgi:hypothetical protein
MISSSKNNFFLRLAVGFTLSVAQIGSANAVDSHDLDRKDPCAVIQETQLEIKETISYLQEEFIKHDLALEKLKSDIKRDKSRLNSFLNGSADTLRLYLAQKKSPDKVRDELSSIYSISSSDIDLVIPAYEQVLKAIQARDTHAKAQKTIKEKIEFVFEKQTEVTYYLAQCQA